MMENKTEIMKKMRHEKKKKKGKVTEGNDRRKLKVARK